MVTCVEYTEFTKHSLHQRHAIREQKIAEVAVTFNIVLSVVLPTELYMSTENTEEQPVITK